MYHHPNRQIYGESSNKDTRLIELKLLLLPHRNQSIDLHCKSNGWFQYGGTIDLAETFQS